MSDRWDGSGPNKELVVGVDEYSAVQHNKLRRNVNAAHARGSKGGELGGSRSIGLIASGATEHPERFLDVVIDWDQIRDFQTVVATIECKTDDAATTVTPRVRDETNGDNFDGVAEDSTSWNEQTIVIDPPAGGGVAKYRLYLIPSDDANQVFGLGRIEVYDELAGVD